MEEQKGKKNTSEDTSRKRRRESGSQTDDKECCSSCRSMADIIADMNRKLDLVLAQVKEIDELKEKQKQLEKENGSLKESLEFKTLTGRVDAQEKMISELKKDVNDLTRSVNSEKECTVKLESYSRRNNLIFYGIPEETNESSAKSESLLYSFLEENLRDRLHEPGWLG